MCDETDCNRSLRFKNSGWLHDKLVRQSSGTSQCTHAKVLIKSFIYVTEHLGIGQGILLENRRDCVYFDFY